MKNTIQQRMNAANANKPVSNSENDPEFEALVDEVSALMQQGKLPEGFDLEEAANDPSPSRDAAMRSAALTGRRSGADRSA